MSRRGPDPGDLLEPPDHSGNPAAPKSADDLTHLRDESYREAGQSIAGRWIEGRWRQPVTYTWPEDVEREEE